MSIARRTVHDELAALSDAISSSSIAMGQSSLGSSGESVLRRGAAITALIMLESFVRDRTEEILGYLEAWPASFSDLPKKLRSRATIESLKNIEKYAAMLQRQDDDYEQLVFDQVRKMACASPPVFSFSKFVAGDYTGNISIRGIEDLLKAFQVKDFWRKCHTLASDIGFGIPDVKQVLSNIIVNRHRSAHVSQFNPNASDIIGLEQEIRLIAICIDAALTSSVRLALNNWQHWISDDFDWLSHIEIFFLIPDGNNYRLKRKGAQRAIKKVKNLAEAITEIPKNQPKTIHLLVQIGSGQRPIAWSIH